MNKIQIISHYPKRGSRACRAPRLILRPRSKHKVSRPFPRQDLLGMCPQVEVDPFNVGAEVSVDLWRTQVPPSLVGS